MEFNLIPVNTIPEYLDVYCGFNGDHEHLPIIWRNTYRSKYAGWASWGRKYGMVNFYHLYHELISKKQIYKFIREFLRIYYHEFMHLFFYYKLGEIYFKGKMRKLHQNEKIIDLLAILLFTEEISHVGNWGNAIFEGEFNV